MDKNPKNFSRKNNELDIAPSDFSQAILRFVIVSGLLIWSIGNAEDKSLSNLSREGFVILTIFYWFFSIGFLAWTKHLNSTSTNTSSLPYRFTRVGAVIADIFAISSYTALAGSHGLILYPIYLQTIIGHGYRYGLPYLYLSNSLGLVGFTAAIFFNRAFAETSLVIAYYLGLLLVPLYSLLLLRKHAEVQAKLKFVNESRSRFIANMSHELRTPLHAILSLNEVLRETLIKGKEQYPPNVAEPLHMVNESAQHLLSLVNRILDIASADQAEKNQTQLEFVNVREITYRAARICSATAYAKGVEVNVYISPTVPFFIKSNKSYLEEIFVNIAGNAVKYTEIGYVTIFVSTSVSQHELEVRIVDSGVGIKEALLPTIFEPFTMGDDAAARKHYGTGLGLTITKQYIASLGGGVEISSKVGVGTAVDIHLPLETDKSEIPKPSSRVFALIVSESDISAPERLLFEHNNFDVVTASLNQAASANFDNEHVDVVLISSVYADRNDDISNLNRSIHAPFVGYLNQIVTKPEIGEENFIFETTIRPGIKADIALCHYLINSHDTNDLTSEDSEESFNILVADDNDINLATARLALESVGHHVDLVNNGEDALRALSTADYDLVLMDMHMPGMNGIEVSKLYSYECDDPVPIILLTADVTEEAKIEAQAANVAAMFSKPILPQELRKAVKKYARKESVTVKDIGCQRLNVETKESIHSQLTLVVNTSEIRELTDCGATTHELLEMIQIFESDALHAIELAIKAGNEERHSVIRAQMHSLRGAAGALGAETIQKIAHDIEVFPIVANGAPISMMEELIPLVKDTAARLKEEVASVASDATPELD